MNYKKKITTVYIGMLKTNNSANHIDGNIEHTSIIVVE